MCFQGHCTPYWSSPPDPIVVCLWLARTARAGVEVCFHLHFVYNFNLVLGLQVLIVHVALDIRIRRYTCTPLGVPLSNGHLD